MADLLDRRRVGWAVAAGLVLALVVVLVLRPWAAVAGEGRWTGPPGAWEQVFAEEFEGTALDRRVWRPDRGGDQPARPFNPTTEGAWFDPSNVVVSGGLLRLVTDDEPRTVAGTEYGFSTGMVQTVEAVLRPPVYVEARIRVPACDGCWPAFWLHPADRWPPEIDVVEFMESGSEPRPSFNYIDPEEDRSGPQFYGEADRDYRGEFHTYGVLWDGERAVPWLDGVPYEQFAATEDMTSLPMTVILNLSLRDGYDLRPGERTDVDWVRAWVPSPGS